MTKEEALQSKGNEDGEEEIISLDSSFFVNRDYELTEFTFGSNSLQLLCLRSASTDYDLTGQLVWPGAVLMNNYLSSHAEILSDKSIIELGSGVVPSKKDPISLFIIFGTNGEHKDIEDFMLCRGLVGITGMLCSRFCKEAVLTDHNDEVLEIIWKNIELEASRRNQSLLGLTAEKLEWGNREHMEQILHKHPSGFDLVLGADICFQQSSIPHLFVTVHQLLQVKGRGGKFILAYVSRAETMDAMVVNEAVKHGLQINEVEGTRTTVSKLEGVIFEITLDS